MPMQHPHILSIKAALTIPCFAAAAAIAFLVSRGFPVPNAIFISVSGGAVLAGMLILGSDKCLEDLQHALSANALWILAIIIALSGIYSIYSIATNTAGLRPVLVMAAYLSMPFFLLAKQRGVARSTWLDAAAILWIWLPLELGIMRRLLVPSATMPGLHYVFAEGLAINVGIVAFGAWRRFRGIGYRFEFSWKTISVAVLSFVLFAAIAIPLGLSIHFIRYSFELQKLLFAPAAFLGIFLFTAIPEELLFRGLIQNWFERRAVRPILSLLIASVVFGASHLNNGPPIPNYKYFLLATIAGLFYGWTWKQTGSLTASAITHALVDTAWSVLFR
jgi:CAAX protease family protein